MPRYSLSARNGLRSRASIDGRPTREVRVSTYVKPGFEVHLGSGTIGPGRQGTLHVEFTMPEMVYQDTTDEKLASLRITPTWFGDQYVRGNTHILVAVQLPKSVTPDEALHQGPEAGPPFALKAVTDRGALVGWDWPADRLTGSHMVAVSFPKRDLKRVSKATCARSRPPGTRTTSCSPTSPPESRRRRSPTGSTPSSTPS